MIDVHSELEHLLQDVRVVPVRPEQTGSQKQPDGQPDTVQDSPSDVPQEQSGVPDEQRDQATTTQSGQMPGQGGMILNPSKMPPYILVGMERFWMTDLLIDSLPITPVKQGASGGETLPRGQSDLAPGQNGLPQSQAGIPQYLIGEPIPELPVDSYLPLAELPYEDGYPVITDIYEREALPGELLKSAYTKESLLNPQTNERTPRAVQQQPNPSTPAAADKEGAAIQPTGKAAITAPNTGLPKLLMETMGKLLADEMATIGIAKQEKPTDLVTVGKQGEETGSAGKPANQPEIDQLEKRGMNAADWLIGKTTQGMPQQKAETSWSKTAMDVLFATGLNHGEKGTDGLENLPTGMKEQPMGAEKLLAADAERMVDTDPEKLGTKELVRQIHSLLLPMADAKGVQLAVELRGDSVQPLRLNSVRLQQVVMRLLTAAVKLSHNGGKLDFILENQVREDGRMYLRAVVQERGVGLSEEVMTYLWAKQPAPLPMDPANLALNLALCKNLAAEMGGSLVIRSWKGEGSLFLLELMDRLLEDDQDQQRLSGRPVIGRFSGKRILLAETHTVDAEQDARLLQQREMLVDAVGTGKEAVRLFKQSVPGEYAAILLSARLPLMDGPTAAREIRGLERPDAVGIPIIMLTEKQWEGDVAKALGAEADLCLVRPILPQTLYQALDCCIL